VRFRLKNSEEKSFFPLTGLIKQVGRSMECDIVVADPGVSRLHARLDKSEEDWVLVDLESRNGTLVNGEKIREIKLQPGDVIQLGGASFVFEAEPGVDESDESTKLEPGAGQPRSLLNRLLGREKP
jgi:pSer/pThr/pTyr-binding forkhead associated (FHA) protein